MSTKVVELFQFVYEFMNNKILAGSHPDEAAVMVVRELGELIRPRREERGVFRGFWPNPADSNNQSVFVLSPRDCTIIWQREKNRN